MAGIHRIQTAKLTMQKNKGKALTKAIGEVFAPKEVIKVNSSIGKKDSSGGYPKAKKNKNNNK